MRRDHDAVPEELYPYYQDVYDHILRVSEATDALRDLVSTIVETNLSLQDYRQNQIVKKVSSWAAIIAVPAFLTGYFGMNVPYPGIRREPPVSSPRRRSSSRSPAACTGHSSERSGCDGDAGTASTARTRDAPFAEPRRPDPPRRIALTARPSRTQPPRTWSVALAVCSLTAVSATRRASPSWRRRGQRRGWSCRTFAQRVGRSRDHAAVLGTARTWSAACRTQRSTVATRSRSQRGGRTCSDTPIFRTTPTSQVTKNA